MNKLYLGLVALLLVGCGDAITPHNYEQAVKACEPHEGLSYVYKDAMKYSPEAHCNNGVKLTGLAPLVRK